MKLIKTNSLLTILFALLFAPFLAFSQTNDENVLSKAIQLFDKGNFKEAEPLFNKVLKEKPADFMVNYFYGACRTENNHFTNTDLDCLINANLEVSPLKINYYFGIQYHARSNWERALKFYNKYNSTTSLSENDKQLILIKIQQCYDKINPYEEFILEEDIEDNIPVVMVNAIEDTLPDYELKDQDSAIEKETLVVASASETGNNTQYGEPINFYVNNEITYLNTSHFKTEKGKMLFKEGIFKQKKLDLNAKKTGKLRKDYAGTKTRDEKNSIGEKILLLENETYELNKDVSQILTQAKNIENEYWQNATSEEIKDFKEKLNQISTQIEIETDDIGKQNIDSITFIDPNILLGNSDIIISNVETKEKDLIYKIQIGAYSRGLPNYIKKLFDKLSFIRKIENYTDDRGVVVYTTGNLTNYEDALKMQNQVRQEGVEDAYVVPYFKGKRITLGQAKELERE